MKVDWSSVEFVYSPVIQSQNTKDGYDLRASAESSDDSLAHKGIVLVSLGMRYKSYCSSLGRTFMVDPSKVSVYSSISVIFIIVFSGAGGQL